MSYKNRGNIKTCKIVVRRMNKINVYNTKVDIVSKLTKTSQLDLWLNITYKYYNYNILKHIY